jgi:hypothetical protein
LDTRREGHLDLKGFQRGLKRMDHREYLISVSAVNQVQPTNQLSASTALKNADSLLHDILNTVDTSGDGKIQFNGTIQSIMNDSTYLTGSRIPIVCPTRGKGTLAAVQSNRPR